MQPARHARDAHANPEARADLAVVELDLVNDRFNLRAREAVARQAAQRRVDGRLHLRRRLGRDVLEADGEGGLLLVAAIARAWLGL